MSSNRFSLGRVILAFVGLAILVMGMALSVSNAAFIYGATRTTGTVVALTWEGPDKTAQRPTIAYKDFDGKAHTVPADSASSEHTYAVGDHVPILYNFRTNDELRLDTWANGWQPGIIAGLLGLFMLRQAFRSRRPAVGGPSAKVAPWTDATPTSGDTSAMIQAIGRRHEKPGTTPAASPVTPRQPVRPAPTPNVPTVRRMR